MDECCTDISTKRTTAGPRDTGTIYTRDCLTKKSLTYHQFIKNKHRPATVNQSSQYPPEDISPNKKSSQQVAMEPPVSSFDVPMYVDHAHERRRQHTTFLGVIARQAPNQKGHPNYPDVDISDGLSHFYIDIEVPGVNDPEALTLEWKGPRCFILSGTATRPRTYLEHFHGPSKSIDTQESGKSESLKRVEKVTSHENGDSKKDVDDGVNLPPWLVVAERKIGFFRREFQFPVEVEMDRLVAKLEAGLLRVDVPKKVSRAHAESGKVKIEAV